MWFKVLSAVHLLFVFCVLFSIFLKKKKIIGKALDNKDLNQISVPSGFRENKGLVRVPILAGSQIWFQSLSFKDFQFIVEKVKTPAMLNDVSGPSSIGNGGTGTKK